MAVYSFEVALAILFIYFFTFPMSFSSWKDLVTPSFVVLGFVTLLCATRDAYAGHPYRGSAAMLVFGATAALFLTYHHYALLGDPSLSFCSINQTVSCDIVNTSEYSELFGIPIALFGFLTYASLLVFLFLFHRKKSQRLLTIAQIISGFSVLFTLYLVYVSKFIIGAWCPLCMITYIVNISVFVFLWFARKRQSIATSS